MTSEMLGTINNVTGLKKPCNSSQVEILFDSAMNNSLSVSDMEKHELNQQTNKHENKDTY